MTWGKDSASRPRGSFEDEWPDLARGLDRALRARHVPAPRREDIVQDTGLRLFVRWPDLDPARPLWPFALTVAMNLLKDEQRMQARRYAAAPPHTDEIVERGVEEEALARLELTDVQTALQKLTPAQRSVLLADIGAGPYDDRGPAALKMLRMRARRTLRTVIDRASALVPLASLKLRRASSSVGTTLQRNAGLEQARDIALSTLGFAGAVSILGAAWGVAALPGSEVGGIGTEAVRTAAAASARDVDDRNADAVSRARDGRATVTVERRALTGVGRAHRHTRGRHAPAQVKAGGTGIDEEPSLSSKRYRVWIFARAVAAGQEAELDYEVRQANPVCGSPAGPGDGSGACIRARAPSARGGARLAGQGTNELRLR